MNWDKAEDYMENDIQDDAIYTGSKLKDICISNIRDEVIIGGELKSPDERCLERILHPCYINVGPVYPKITALHEETLFYIFYMCPADRIQESAFYLLLELGYFFCTTLKCFVSFTEKNVAEQLVAGKSILDNSKHKIVIFDPFSWEKLTKEVVYDKDFIESLKYLCK